MADFITSWLTPTSLFLLLNIVIGTIFLISRLFPPKTPQHQQFEHDDYNSAPPLQRSPSLLERVKSINFLTYRHPLPNQDIDHHLQPNNLAANQQERAPSILERVKSINFFPYKFSPQNPDTDYVEPTEHDYTNQQPLSRSPSRSERVKSIDSPSSYRSDSVKSNQQTETPTTEETDSDTDTSPVHGQVKRSKSENCEVIERKPSFEKMKKSATEILRHKAEEEEDQEEVERRRPTTGKTVSIGDDDQGVDEKADAFINKFKQQLKLQRWNSFLRYRDKLKNK